LEDSERVLSPFGTEGRRQRFDGSSETPLDQVTVYASPRGTFAVGSSIRIVHDELGGAVGRMGLPTSEEIDARDHRKGERRCYQPFEGGRIYATSGRTIAVRKAVVKVFASAPGLERQLGFPREDEQRLADGEDDAVQFFQNGVVTIRGGRAQAWIRPGGS
jgi:uncharacterized protein with LGFP repeats